MEASSVPSPLKNVVDWIVSRKKMAYDFSEVCNEDFYSVGGKAAGISEMSRLKIPVPLGFVLSSEACDNYSSNNMSISVHLQDEIGRHMHRLEQATGRLFGSAANLTSPLLLSVRVSSIVPNVPGEIETVLNVGMNDQLVHALAAFTKSPRFAFDSYRRFIQSYGEHVLKVKESQYESIIKFALIERGVELVDDLSTYDLQGIINDFKNITKIPIDPWEQLLSIIEAVYQSWYAAPASMYRDTHEVSTHQAGPGIIIQQMMHGNIDEFSGAGIISTRNPCTGQKSLTGEYLPKSEGDEMFSFVRSFAKRRDLSYAPSEYAPSDRSTPDKPNMPTECSRVAALDTRDAIDATEPSIAPNASSFHLNYPVKSRIPFSGLPPAHYGGAINTLGELQLQQPKVFDKLLSICEKLESAFKDAQDLEFTVQNGLVYILECESERRSAKAAVKICCDMVNERVISEREALMRLDPHIATFFENSHMIEPLPSDCAIEMSRHLLAQGEVVSSAGVASGLVVFNEHQLDEVILQGKEAVLVVNCLNGGSLSAHALSTASGFILSHGHINSCIVAVQARAVGKCGISFTHDHLLSVDYEKQLIRCSDGVELHQGSFVTLDGFQGNVYKGTVRPISARYDSNFQMVMSWSRAYKDLPVMAMIRCPQDVFIAREGPIEGVGLCRTDHFFVQSNCEDLKPAQLLGKSGRERTIHMENVLQSHQTSILGVFRNLPSRHISFQLMGYFDKSLLCGDLCEFPVDEEEKELHALAQGLQVEGLSDPYSAPFGCDNEELMADLHGCQLAMIYPEVAELQVKAIIGAAVQASKSGYLGDLEICTAYVRSSEEADHITALIRKTAENTMKALKWHVEFSVGVSLDVPRVCLMAASFAKPRESTGDGGITSMILDTDALTRWVFGFEKDEVQQFLRVYMQKHIFSGNPFDTLDNRCVGALLEIAIQQIRSANPKIRIGVCGSQCADPKSIRFLNGLQVDFVCVPTDHMAVAIIAAARAQIKHMNYLMKDYLYHRAHNHVGHFGHF